MVCGIINNAIALIDESLGAAIFGGVFDIGFVIRAFWQCRMIIACVRGVIVEFVAANHHANGCPRVEIPFFKSLAGLGFVKVLPFVLAHVIAWQLVEFAQVCRHRIARSVLAGFLNRIEDRFTFFAGRTFNSATR